MNIVHSTSRNHSYGNNSDNDFDSDLEDIDLENAHATNTNFRNNDSLSSLSTINLRQGNPPTNNNKNIAQFIQSTPNRPRMNDYNNNTNNNNNNNNTNPIPHTSSMQKPELTQAEKLCRRIKYAVLLLPACFILGVIIFVTYCTLYLAIPWRYNQEKEKRSFAILSILSAIIFLQLSIMTIWSFLRCVFTSSHVSNNPPTNKNNINMETTRVCAKCFEYKPQRAHHCSICSQCTLKMDHHCPWVANCVGYYNYKYFVLFIWYATLGCHLSSIICVSQMYQIISGTSHVQGSISTGYTGVHHGWMMINSLLTLAFGVTLTCFSIFHGSLVVRGLTTIEVGMGDNPFDLGYKQNFISIFGNNWKYMFLPIPTMSGDGYEFADNNPLFGGNESSSDDGDGHDEDDENL